MRNNVSELLDRACAGCVLLERNMRSRLDTLIEVAWRDRLLLQNIELMLTASEVDGVFRSVPQYQDFGFQPPPRFEAVAQHADGALGRPRPFRLALSSLASHS